MNNDEKTIYEAKKLFREELINFFDANPFKYSQASDEDYASMTMITIEIIEERLLKAKVQLTLLELVQKQLKGGGHG